MMNHTRILGWAVATLCGVLACPVRAEAPAGGPTTRPDSVLVRLAASMKPGTFALLNRDGDGSGYGWDLLKGGAAETAPVGSIFAYAQKAVYDPVGDRVYFRGAPHYQGKGRWGDTQICYDVASNRWTSEFPTPTPCGHAYDTNAINPAAREVYASSQLMNSFLRRRNVDTGKWEPMTQPESVGFGFGEASAEYFPERDELLWVQNRLLGAWKQSTNEWRRIAPLPDLHFRSPVARYVPRHGCVMIIGGADTNKKPTEFSRAVYKYDRDGKVTRQKDSPASIKVYISRSTVAVDPVSGEVLFIQAVLGDDINDFTGRIEFWSYDISADRWTQLDAGVVPAIRDWWDLNYPFAVVAAPISTHGVTIYMSAARGGKSSVYLYKHATQADADPAGRKTDSPSDSPPGRQ